MNKRQFTSQASSSRALSNTGFGTHGGFGFTGNSKLSYVVEPLDLGYISDGNVVVAFKGLLKKDDITKAKALEDLRAHIQAHPNEHDGGVEEPILDAWVGPLWPFKKNPTFVV